MRTLFRSFRAVAAISLALLLLFSVGRLFAADPDVYMSSQGAYSRDH